MSPWLTCSLGEFGTGQGLHLTGEGALEGPPFSLEWMGED